jgi:hypothetical protein
MTPLYFDKGKREKSRGEKISSSKPNDLFVEHMHNTSGKRMVRRF